MALPYDAILATSSSDLEAFAVSHPLAIEQTANLAAQRCTIKDAENGGGGGGKARSMRYMNLNGGDKPLATQQSAWSAVLLSPVGNKRRVGLVGRQGRLSPALRSQKFAASPRSVRTLAAAIGENLSKSRTIRRPGKSGNNSSSNESLDVQQKKESPVPPPAPLRRPSLENIVATPEPPAPPASPRRELPKKPVSPIPSSRNDSLSSLEGKRQLQSTSRGPSVTLSVGKDAFGTTPTIRMGFLNSKKAKVSSRDVNRQPLRVSDCEGVDSSILRARSLSPSIASRLSVASSQRAHEERRPNSLSSISVSGFLDMSIKGATLPVTGQATATYFAPTKSRSAFSRDQGDDGSSSASLSLSSLIAERAKVARPGQYDPVKDESDRSESRSMTSSMTSSGGNATEPQPQPAHLLPSRDEGAPVAQTNDQRSPSLALKLLAELPLGACDSPSRASKSTARLVASGAHQRPRHDEERNSSTKDKSKSRRQVPRASMEDSERRRRGRSETPRDRAKQKGKSSSSKEIPRASTRSVNTMHSELSNREKQTRKHGQQSRRSPSKHVQQRSGSSSPQQRLSIHGSSSSPRNQRSGSSSRPRPEGPSNRSQKGSSSRLRRHSTSTRHKRRDSTGSPQRRHRSDSQHAAPKSHHPTEPRRHASNSKLHERETANLESRGSLRRNNSADTKTTQQTGIQSKSDDRSLSLADFESQARKKKQPVKRQAWGQVSSSSIVMTPKTPRQQLPSCGNGSCGLSDFIASPVARRSSRSQLGRTASIGSPMRSPRNISTTAWGQTSTSSLIMTPVSPRRSVEQRTPPKSTLETPPSSRSPSRRSVSVGSPSISTICLMDDDESCVEQLDELPSALQQLKHAMQAKLRSGVRTSLLDSRHSRDELSTIECEPCAASSPACPNQRHVSHAIFDRVEYSASHTGVQSCREHRSCNGTADIEGSYKETKESNGSEGHRTQYRERSKSRSRQHGSNASSSPRHPKRASARSEKCRGKGTHGPKSPSKSPSKSRSPAETRAQKETREQQTRRDQCTRKSRSTNTRDSPGSCARASPGQTLSKHSFGWATERSQRSPEKVPSAQAALRKQAMSSNDNGKSGTGKSQRRHNSAVEGSSPTKQKISKRSVSWPAVPTVMSVDDDDSNIVVANR